MARDGTYYVGRVLKYGNLDANALLAAFRNPATIRYRKNAWTFVDVNEAMCADTHFVFGRLCKFTPEGEVTVVDTASRSEIRQDEPNLHIASSPFVYIPAFSGIVYLHVSNDIEYKTFITRFCDIVKASHQGFFVDCDIELVSDLKTFAAKLRSLDGIFQINAKVSPPNPLFGPLWKELEEYLRTRNTDRMTLQENAPEAGTLQTDLPKFVEKASEQTETDPYIPDRVPPIGDAAVLMAADGYGSGIIRGRRENDVVVIRTSETALNFSFNKVPEPIALAERAMSIFESIRDSRHMTSDD